jgi:hypothetical protein
MPASADSPIKPQIKKIDGLSIRYAESEPREVSAILLSLSFNLRVRVVP